MLVGKEDQDHNLLNHKKNNKGNCLMLRLSWSIIPTWRLINTHGVIGSTGRNVRR
ncbi:hypothetical protein A2U01_0093114, partial [Trifolium medium]|nr:hypothetical protein [Trifolium medium]